MSYKYERYISHVTRHPWAILPEKLAVINDLILYRAAGHRLSDEEIKARISSDDQRRSTGTATDGSVAVIPIVGCIAYRGDSFEASSGGTSAQAIGAYLRRCVADDSVKSILLDLASPGGSVEGIPELAEQIFAAKAAKPIVASVNADACSAAYWLASQASEIAITPSGLVGSIGVYMVLIDETKALEKQGYQVNAISAGDNKLEGAPWTEMSDETRAHFQGQVDAIYKSFLAAVARGRGVSVQDVKQNFGQGRVFSAKDALQIGMVDRIETFQSTLDRMVKMRAQKPVGVRAETEPRMALATSASAQAVHDALVAADAKKKADTVDPNEDGTCPEGYEKNEGGKCHMKDEAAKAMAQADLDSAAVTLALLE